MRKFANLHKSNNVIIFSVSIVHMKSLHLIKEGRNAMANFSVNNAKENGQVKIRWQMKHRVV